MLRAALVLLLWQAEHTLAEEFGRNGGAARGGQVHSGCKALADSGGRQVSADTSRGPAASRPAHCPGATVAEPKPAPAQRAIPGPLTGPIHVEKTSGHGSNNEISLKVDPAGVGFAIASSGALLWFVRSGLWASLLVMGLPIWRDLDLLPIVDRASDDSAFPGEASDVVEEQVFSFKPDEGPSTPQSPRTGS